MAEGLPNMVDARRLHTLAAMLRNPAGSGSAEPVGATEIETPA
jgi:hypothetical protein